MKVYVLTGNVRVMGNRYDTWNVAVFDNKLQAEAIQNSLTKEINEFTFENGILELPDSVFDTSLLPVEDKPYCWNYFMDTSHKRPRGYFMHAGLDIEGVYNEDSKQSDTEESSEECTVTTSNV